MPVAATADDVPRDERENDREAGDDTENDEKADGAARVGLPDVAEDEDDECSVEVCLVHRVRSTGMGVCIPREEVRIWEEVRIVVAVVVGRH